MRKFIRILTTTVVFFFLIFSFQNCSNSKSNSDGGQNQNSQFPFSNPNVYFKSTQKIVIEVYYEPGAEPFTGTSNKGTPFWQIFQDNLVSVMQYRSSMPVMVVPKSITEMTAMSPFNRSNWTTADILNLNTNYKQGISSQNESRFYVYFLKGYFDSGTGPSTGTIGVSLSGTPVIAIFKQVVQSTSSNPNGLVPKFVEQSTLIHEMGHALGFVNNGVPLTASYQDSAHGAHSLDANCVMYWQNEGAADLSAFVQKYISSASNVMWGANILSDAKSFSQ